MGQGLNKTLLSSDDDNSKGSPTLVDSSSCSKTSDTDGQNTHTILPGGQPINEKSQPPRQKSLLSRTFKSFRLSLFSSLTRRIVILNLTALAILLATILYLNQFREGLIDAKIASLLTEGQIIASAIAGSATATPDAITIDPEKLLELKAGESLMPTIDPITSIKYPINPEQVAPVLRALIKPTLTRARIYDPEGLLILDSRHLYSVGQILRFDLPPVTANEDIGWVEYIGNGLNRLFKNSEFEIYEDLDGLGTQYKEVKLAFTGEANSVVRQTDKGKLTVSVAVPVQRFRAVLGVLLLSTEGDDIDRIVRDERLAILRIFLVAGIIILVLSALLASTIATPLRRLSLAAKQVKQGVSNRIKIPDFSNRQDEVGELASSIEQMTEALYQRIEAIERFAADVSHELKNPLTSLRSAVETLPLTKTDEARTKLMDIIQHDVKRLDRLITDISDASRLDADLVREHTQSIDLEPLLENIVETSREYSNRKKKVAIELTIQQPKSKKRNYTILGHDARIGQVIHNLVDNAISFVPEVGGKVSINLTKKLKKIIITVQDNGPGIQAENPERIFERFYTDRPDNEEFGQNSGLGLSISRQIIEAHGGTITAKNRSGKQTGARFTVELPAYDATGKKHD